MTRSSGQGARPRPRMHLREVGIQTKTRNRYRNSLRKFFDYLRQHNLPIPMHVSKLDRTVAGYLNHLWMDDAPEVQAADILCGIKRYLPQARRSLHISSFYFSNWRRTIARSRALPITARFVQALVGLAAAWERWDLAALFGLAFTGVLRTDEMVRLRFSDILHGAASRRLHHRTTRNQVRTEDQCCGKCCRAGSRGARTPATSPNRTRTKGTDPGRISSQHAPIFQRDGSPTWYRSRASHSVLFPPWRCDMVAAVHWLAFACRNPRQMECRENNKVRHRPSDGRPSRMEGARNPRSTAGKGNSNCGTHRGPIGAGFPPTAIPVQPWRRVGSKGAAGGAGEGKLGEGAGAALPPGA